ncbi:MAG: hypothetical protein H0T45_04860, partial [Pyrinomonadaceae bacterium]|nr:hypothetical protein [Pyrinomonadaceae bacterium]
MRIATGRFSPKLIFPVVTICLLCAAGASAQKSAQPAGYTIDRYLNIRSVASPALSPRGERVAFLMNVSGTPQVWMMDAAGG